MSVPAQRLLEAPAPNRGLLIWWQPARIAIHRNGRWQTYPYPNYTPIVATAKGIKSVAVSPVGVDGKTHYIAFDVDHGGKEAVRKVLAALRQGCVPLVSKSGGRQGQGYHVWLYLDRPLPVQTAVRFAKAVLLQSGVRCEVFPTGLNSRCLKWPSQKHPQTGKQEVFVHEDDLTTEYDTEAVLQMLAEGHHRTRAEVVEDYAKRHGRAAKGKVSKIDTQPDTQAGHPDAPRGKAKPTQSLEKSFPQIGETFPQIGGIKLVGTLDELATQEELAHEVMRLAGRRPVQLGKAFRCILPGHEERHPSAAWYRQADGHICYHDLHQRDGKEWYTIGEVFYALTTGRVTKLRPVDRARWLAMLGLRCGYATELVLRQRERAKAAAVFKTKLQAEPTSQANLPLPDSLPTKRRYYISGCSPTGDWLVVLKVWAVVEEEALIQAFGGFEEIGLSARFLARRAKVKVELANKAVNLLCVLGLLEKVPNSGGMKGDRFTLTGVDGEEAKRRFGLLFPDGAVNLREFNRALVAAKLGEEVAAAVFRRGTETRSVSKFDTQVDTQPDTELPLHLVRNLVFQGRFWPLIPNLIPNCRCTCPKRHGITHSLRQSGRPNGKGTRSR